MVYCLRILYTFDTTNGIGMSLADALTPERIIIAVSAGLRCAYSAVQGKHARIPAYRNNAYHARSLLPPHLHRAKCSGILRMGIKAVYHVEIFCILCGLFRQIGGGASAQHQDIDLVLHGQKLVCVVIPSHLLKSSLWQDLFW